MINIFLLLNNNENKEKILNILNSESFNIIDFEGEVNDIFTQINNSTADIILSDIEYENIEYIVRQLKSNSGNVNPRIILFLNNDDSKDFIALADGLIQYPVNSQIIQSTINSHYEIKKSLDRLNENNKELSKSLYQLNVLYNTSSQFAGTLNAKKLYDIMIEAMEKTLSFDISSVLIYNPFEKPALSLNTIHTPSDNLVDALKIRSILNYKTIFEQIPLFDNQETDEINLIQKVKQERSSRIYGLEAINFDSLFAPIKVGDDFFGVVELFRQIPYTQEDVTCFQAITHQVALPLRSAKLYEEISIANKKLEKLEKLKSEFISIVSHELRTPLTPINNSLEIVLSGQAGEVTDDARNFISMAKRNIQRLAGIIEDLLDLSRMQTGKLDFRYKIVDISPSLELLMKTFSQVANEKNIRINLTIKDKLPEIYVDIRRIEQIFTNLVSNALKFTSNDGIIDISASVVDMDKINCSSLVLPKIFPSGNYIKVSVKDNGVGIKNEDIPKIFDKFSQIESSLNRNKGGVGLGLTITKQLIDSHLGLIEVISKENEGSCFNVYLPFEDEKKKFIMDLSHALVCDEVGVIKIKYNNVIKLIDILKDNKMITLSKNAKECLIENGEISEYYFYIPKISESSFEAVALTLEEYTNKIATPSCDIMLTKVHSLKEGMDAVKIMEKIDN